MSLIDRLRRRPTPAPDDPFAPMPGFRPVYGEETRFVVDSSVLVLLRAGQGQRTTQEQYYLLDALTEEGRAAHTEDGFVVPAEEVARLDADEARVLTLPDRYAGELRARVRSFTSSPEFSVTIHLAVGDHFTPVRRCGPVVQVGSTLQRLSVPLLRSLRAIEDHSGLTPDRRNENQNVGLVAQLQAAQRLASCAESATDRDPLFRLDLGPLERFRTITPETVSLVVEPQPDGSLAVEPDLGREVSQELVARRWHQLDRRSTTEDEAEAGVIRAGNDIVLLGPQQLAGVREVRRRPTIPAGDAGQFFDAPGAYFDPELVDVDLQFGVRVAGLGVIVPVTFAMAAPSGIAWFRDVDSVDAPETLTTQARTLAEQATLESRVQDAWEGGEDLLTVDERLVDISDHRRVTDALESGRDRLAQLADRQQPGPRKPPTVTVGMHIVEAWDVAPTLRELARQAHPRRPVAWGDLHRRPYAHQRSGIEWMTGLMQAAFASSGPDAVRIQGALLADDMGLGKTYMTLVAMSELLQSEQAIGAPPAPHLAVMPVALLENWRQEIRTTFGSARGPFTDVVVLHGDGLKRYQQSGAQPETAARLDDLDERGMVRPERIRQWLRIGEAHGDRRLDRPGVLVLTTYETLRRYQVSLGLVDWGVVVMDEAQVTKNPETLASRAAKALKARFKLLATGTPVENSLRDFWSLMDTAQPGLLGTWGEFQQRWAIPMSEANGDEHDHLGRQLRQAVGDFMLRRSKEDHLPDLPAKHVREYREPMPRLQVQRYDAVLDSHNHRVGEMGAALKTLHQLAAVSLHPGLLDGRLNGDARTLDDSARTLVTVRQILEGVRTAGEKAIVFAKTKELQRGLALWLREVFALSVDIVNGDTPAAGGAGSRLSKIRAFEAREGFNVIIMSPLAVGVGLTVVGANHAIHLERHWNPAKEAQATDRVHRIGQRREVFVHYPVAVHPRVDSFDVNLDRLLRNKTALKDAVVVPQEVSAEEMGQAMGLSHEQVGLHATA